MTSGRLSREEIVDEIQRVARDLGRAPGRASFEAATGIRESDWSGRYWTKWSDAVAEAGLVPNALNTAYADAVLLLRLAELTRALGHFPTDPEVRIRRRSDATFPSANTFERFGRKADRIRTLADFCAAEGGWEDVAAVCQDSLSAATSSDPKESAPPPEPLGVVYLLKSGASYKIGRSNHTGRRTYEVNLQLPGRAELVHAIETDDPSGIEAYWHRRFADKRLNGEWFRLSKADVAAFKRRKGFM